MLGRLLRMRRRKSLRDLDGILVAGEFLDWKTCCQGIFLLGQPNAGKSHLLLAILEQVAGRTACALTTTKVTDAAEYLGVFQAKGIADRCIRLGQGSRWKLDIGEFFTKTLPGGSARVLAHVINKAGDILANAGGGNNGEQFWAQLIADTLYFCTELAILATGQARLDVILAIINSLPNSPKEVAADDFLTAKCCGRMLKLASDRKTAATDRIYNQVIDFVAERIASVGEKARGAAVQGAGSCLSSLLAEFGDQICTGSNVDLGRLETGKIGTIIDGCSLRTHNAGRAFNFLNAAAFQFWAMASDPDRVDTPTFLFRDEIGWVLNLSHDASIQAVARGVKLASVSAGQNFPVIAGGMGGSDRARMEAEAFASMHNCRCMFANAEPTTTEWCSKLIGDHLETFVSSNGCHQPSHDLMDLALGVNTSHSYSSHYERRVRPADFSRLKTGQLYINREGRTRFADLWEDR